MPRERRSKYANDAVDNAQLASSLAQSMKHHTSTRYLLSQLKSGKSIPVLIVGDSTSTSSFNWEAQLFKKLGQEYGYNVLHGQYHYGQASYEEWEWLHTAGEERCIRTEAGKSARSLTGKEIVAISDDVDISLRLSLDQWKNGQTKYLLNRWGDTARCWNTFLAEDNTFYFYWSANGADVAEMLNFNLVNTANNVDGEAYWYRFTLDVNDGSGHYVAKCWTSDNGLDWTVAQTITGASITSVFKNDSQSYGLGCSSSPSGSTGSTVGKFYEVRIRDGIDGIIVNPQPIETWRQTESDSFNGQHVEGTPTIYVYNSAIGGYNLEFYSLITKYAPKMYMPIVIVSLSYNEAGAHGELYLTEFEELLTKIKDYVKYPIITVVSQAPTITPAANITQHKQRVNELAGYAAFHNYDNINMYEGYLESGIELSNLLNSDGLHPNATGQTLMANIAYDYYKS
jgi:hypothetical protein